MTLLLPQSSWPGLDGAGQGAARHTTQCALPVWSTTHDCGRRQTTWAQDSVGGAWGRVKSATPDRAGSSGPSPSLHQKPHPFKCPAHSLVPPLDPPLVAPKSHPFHEPRHAPDLPSLSPHFASISSSDSHTRIYHPIGAPEAPFPNLHPPRPHSRSHKRPDLVILSWDYRPCPRAHTYAPPTMGRTQIHETYNKHPGLYTPPLPASDPPPRAAVAASNRMLRPGGPAPPRGSAPTYCGSDPGTSRAGPGGRDSARRAARTRRGRWRRQNRRPAGAPGARCNRARTRSADGPPACGRPCRGRTPRPRTNLWTEDTHAWAAARGRGRRSSEAQRPRSLFRRIKAGPE